MPEQIEPPVVETSQTDSTDETREINHAEPIMDRAELESKTSAALKAVFGDETVSKDEAPKDGEPATETQEESATAVTDTKDEVETPVAATVTTESKAPTLPAAYVRTLKALEWTDEEIADAAGKPELLSSITKLHNSRVKETQEWARLGRAAKEAQQVPASQKTVETSQGLKPIDAEALKKIHGEDKLIDDLVNPLNKTIAEINRILPMVQETQKTSQRAELETLGKQIEGFFGEKELAPFKEVYGNAKTGLNEIQLQSRNKVLEMADALMAGAKQQGRDLTLNEALSFAHDSVSSEFKEKAVRTTITKQMKTRERGITLRPGGKTTVVPGKTVSRADLERNVGAGLASVFGRS